MGVGLGIAGLGLGWHEADRMGWDFIAAFGMAGLGSCSPGLCCILIAVLPLLPPRAQGDLVALWEGTPLGPGAAAAAGFAGAAAGAAGLAAGTGAAAGAPAAGIFRGCWQAGHLAVFPAKESGAEIIFPH